MFKESELNIFREGRKGYLLIDRFGPFFSKHVHGLILGDQGFAHKISRKGGFRLLTPFLVVVLVFCTIFTGGQIRHQKCNNYGYRVRIDHFHPVSGFSTRKCLNRIMNFVTI